MPENKIPPECVDCEKTGMDAVNCPIIATFMPDDVFNQLPCVEKYKYLGDEGDSGGRYNRRLSKNKGQIKHGSFGRKK